LGHAYPQELGNATTNEAPFNYQGYLPAVPAQGSYDPLSLYDLTINNTQQTHLGNVNTLEDWTLSDKSIVPSVGNSFLTPMLRQPSPFLTQPFYPAGVAGPGHAFQPIAPAAVAAPQPNVVAPPSLPSGVHADVHRRIIETRIRCTVSGCTKTFRRPGDHRRHMRKHQDPELKCIVNDCDMKFYRLDKLRDHIRQGHKMVL
jgi:hypothetical protein